MKILVIVDMQKDFLYEGRPLYNKDAAKVIQPIVKRVEQARENKECIIFTADAHAHDYNETIEGKNLPLHCSVDKNEYDIIDEFGTKPKLIVYKETFLSFQLVRIIQSFVNMEEEDDLEIEVCGVLTSICVLSNVLALRSAFPKSVIKVNKSLCGDSRFNNEASFVVMRNNFIEVT